MTSDAQQVQLVITAPAPFAEEFAYAVRARSTLGVLIELLAAAERRIILAAPFVQAEAVLELGLLGSAIVAALNRGVSVDILSTRRNLNLPVVQGYARKHSNQVRLFYPAFPMSDSSELGSHAKFCIQDDESAYVGSANLTGPGLGGARSKTRFHFEMGLLIRGRPARELSAFWLYALRFGVFAELRDAGATV